MRIRKIVNNLIEDVRQLYADHRTSFNNVKKDIDTLTSGHNIVANNLAKLTEEIATNGVIRDLRGHDKAIKDLQAYIDNRFDELGHNGVATAINKLNAEVFPPKQSVDKGWDFANHMTMRVLGYNPAPEPTLVEKVNAIIEHLGIDVSVQPEKKIVAKAVVTKKAVKKTTKKRK